MIIELFDYDKKKHTIDADISDAFGIVIEVVSGDEILTVLKTDGHVVKYDPMKPHRRIDYYDYNYFVRRGNTNLLQDERWLNRDDSYECETSDMIPCPWIGHQEFTKR